MRIVLSVIVIALSGYGLIAKKIVELAPYTMFFLSVLLLEIGIMS